MPPVANKGYMHADIFLIKGTVGSHMSYEDMRVDSAMPSDEHYRAFVNIFIMLSDC